MPRRLKITAEDKCLLFVLRTRFGFPVGLLATMFRIGIVYVYKIIAARRAAYCCSRCTCVLRALKSVPARSNKPSRQSFGE